ncbi:sugar ABC transporter permease [Kaistia defluvii]|uniref:carbohydrate ABC transporter permease n=1 Tax=Kaistia defluvii TaxID=410841 RepID=UPI002255436D|nr:sugar ABC transporter permease [Kaistia defluvii]MCX5520401.1 sugar ABC transporter permease [Kaistia defluvii]
MTRTASGPSRYGRWGFLFCLPALLFIAIFQLYPVLFSYFISLHEYDLLSPPRYVGFKYYLGLASDKAFLRSLGITITYVVYTVVPVLGIAFWLGWSLTKLGRSRGVWRTLIFLPSVMPLVSVALTWKLLLNVQGPVNDGLGFLGMAPVSWLTSSAMAPWALILVSWWHATSYYTIIFLAGFLAIPRDHYEAAALDGARGWSVLRHITLPSMKPTIALVVVLSTVNGLKTFAFQQIMTDGGPAGSTQILTLLIYKTSFSFLQMGKASTYSVVLFTGILVISLLQIWLLRDRHRHA